MVKTACKSTYGLTLQVERAIDFNLKQTLVESQTAGPGSILVERS